MADNVTYGINQKATPTVGTVVRSDDVGGVQYQVVKLDLGGDGVSVPVVNVMPVWDVSGTQINVTIGDVLITGSIQISNFPPVQDVAIVSGSISTTPAPMQGVSGTVAVSNFPADYLITGTVHVDNIPDMQGVSGSVSVNNFPSLYYISGSVAVINYPAVQDVNIVSGTVSVTPPDMQGVSGSVSVQNFPSLYEITGSVGVLNYPALQGISGSVSVSNFPPLQGISGTVAATVAFPVTQGVSGSVSISNFPQLQGVSGSVNVGNFPGLQGISGSVAATVTFPALQGVSGTVSVLNFPATQNVAIISGSVTATPPVMQGVSGSVAVFYDPLSASAPTGSVVGVASGLIVSANSNRKGLVLVNTSGAWISVGIGASAILYRGISLSPSGGSFSMDSFSYSTAAIYAIASKANSNLAIQEFS